MTLTVTEMPTSFSGEALSYALQSRLNPASDALNNQRVYSYLNQAIDITFSITKLGLLILYGLGVGLLCAPLGVVYHAGQALRWKWNAVVVDNSVRAHALAREHLKACFIDLVTIPLSPWAGPISLLDGLASWGLWFSASQVRTGLPAVVEGAGNVDPFNNPFIAHNSHLHWGTTPAATPDSCPYNKLRAYSTFIYTTANRQVLPFNDPEIIGRVCVGVFQEANISSKLWSNFWPKRPAFLSHSYALTKGANTPEYKYPWQFAAFVVATVGSLALTAVAFSAANEMNAQLFTVAQNAKATGLGVAATLGIFLGGFCYQKGMKIWTQTRGDAEAALAQRLMTTNTPDNKRQTRENMQQALFWLHQAANRGRAPIQRSFGLSLLASLPDPLDREDSSTLSIAQEGVSWLQAAGINDDSPSNREMLRAILVLTSNRLLVGIRGDSPEERTANMLKPLNMDAARAAFQQLYPNANVLEKITNALVEPRRNARTAAIMKAVEAPLSGKPVSPYSIFPVDLVAIVSAYIE